MHEIILKRIKSLYETNRIGGEQLEAYVSAGLITSADAAQRVYEQEQLAGAVQTIDELCDYIAGETV